MQGNFVTLELAPNMKGPSLEGTIEVNRDHVVAIKQLKEQSVGGNVVTALFLSNFQINVSGSAEGIKKKLRISNNNPSNQGEN